jgi:hypothetical protein
VNPRLGLLDVPVATRSSFCWGTHKAELTAEVMLIPILPRAH